jgi:hypothetical protein
MFRGGAYSDAGCMPNQVCSAIVRSEQPNLKGGTSTLSTVITVSQMVAYDMVASVCGFTLDARTSSKVVYMTSTGVKRR